jgi:molybdopterin molybdotransferase
VSEKVLISVSEYSQSVLAGIFANSVDDVPIDDTLGLAVATDIAAPISSPQFANSAMDGYAVRAQDIAAAPVELVVADDIPAGATANRPLDAGTAHRIMTGAPVPSGADTVVRVEWTNGGTSRVRIDRAVEYGTAIRRAGEDFTAGSPLIGAGSLVTPGLIGLAASVGLTTLPVYRRPRVAIAATGDELVSPGADLQRGQIFDSNSHLMAALMRRAEVDVVSVTTLSDDVDAAIGWLTKVASDCDLVVTMGGVSAGAYEVVRDVFAQVGTMKFVQVAVQPGKPQGFGHLGDTPVISLPGNPVSAAVSFELFVVPALRKVAGYPASARQYVTVRTTGELRRSADRTRYLPAWVDLAESVVSTPDVHGSHRLSTIRATNCLIEVPAGNPSIAAGEPVRVILTADSR